MVGIRPKIGRKPRDLGGLAAIWVDRPRWLIAREDGAFLEGFARHMVADQRAGARWFGALDADAASAAMLLVGVVVVALGIARGEPPHCLLVQRLHLLDGLGLRFHGEERGHVLEAHSQ